MTLGPTFVIIAFQPVKKWIGINPTGLSAPRSNSLEIIYLLTIEKSLGINPTRLSYPRADSLEVITLSILKNGEGLNQWALFPLGQILITTNVINVIYCFHIYCSQ